MTRPAPIIETKHCTDSLHGPHLDIAHCENGKNKYRGGGKSQGKTTVLQALQALGFIEFTSARGESDWKSKDGRKDRENKEQSLSKATTAGQSLRRRWHTVPKAAINLGPIREWKIEPLLILPAQQDGRRQGSVAAGFQPPWHGRRCQPISCRAETKGFYLECRLITHHRWPGDTFVFASGKVHSSCHRLVEYIFTMGTWL